MTDDEFEDPDRRQSSDAAEEQQRLDDRINDWRSCIHSEEGLLENLAAARKGTHGASRCLLACIYSLAQKLKVGGTLDSRLREAIAEFPEHEDRKRQWQPKDGYDVALTYALGLSRDVASTKSNWRKTLTQAEDEEIEYTEEAFLAWVEGVGGEEKARRPEKREKFDLEKFAKAVPGAPEPKNAFQVDLPAAEVMPGGFAVVLAKVYRRDGDRCLLQPIEVFTDERSVETAAYKVKRKWDAVTQAEARKLQRERDKEQKHQQQLDAHGYRPAKRKQAKKRKHPMPLKNARRLKPKGPTIAEFLNDSARPSKQHPQ